MAQCLVALFSLSFPFITCFLSTTFVPPMYWTCITLPTRSGLNARYGYGNTYNTPYYSTYPSGFSGYPTVGRGW